MLSQIIEWSLNNRLLVLFLSLLLVLTGLWSLKELPIDAFPDTTPVQIQINTVTPSLSPEEIEQQVTLPVELAISGLPGLHVVRSVSKFGFSQVMAIFDDSIDIYLARQVVNERLQTVQLPVGIRPPELGPVSTGLGEVFHYVVSSSKRDLTELRTLHDWVVKPILRSVPGVAEINSWGGFVKQYQVLVDPLRLLKFNLGMDDLKEALENNNATMGGGNVIQAGEQVLVHGVGLVTTIPQIENIVITSHDGVPIKVRDVADVEVGHEIRRGAVTAMGQGEALLGLGFMLMGENTRIVAQRLEDRLEEVRQALPPDVKIDVVYNRMDLVDRVLHTARKNLFEGALLVIAILFALMGNLRAGLIVALSIPLSMLFAFNLMLKAGIAGSLLSLGAIDFGIVVDSSVIMVENSVRRIAEKPPGRSFIDTIKTASLEVRKPTLFGEAIIMIVYLPILTLEGVEGKLFRPMALTVIFCLLGSLVLSLTLMPVLASLFLPKRIKHRENFILRGVKFIYDPLLRLSMKARPLVLGLCLLLLAITIRVGMNIGTEFIPVLSEGSIVINTVRLAGVSLEESIRYGSQIEQTILRKFPDEVNKVWTRTGTPEITTDPMGLEVSDIFMTLKPREEWKKASSQEELVSAMGTELSTFPGMRMVFTQPIEMRLAEMTAGVRAELGVKVFGDDFQKLASIAQEIDALLRRIPGASDVSTEQLTGQPVFQATLDQEALARYGIPGRGVLEIIGSVGGLEAGEIREGQRRFDLVVRLKEEYRRNPDRIRDILIPNPNGANLPLSELASLRYIDAPSSIQREWGKRRITIQCNVRERDIGSFVKEARQKISEQVSLPTGYYIGFGGQFEHMVTAQQRLIVVVPLALGLIFFLLYMSFHSVRDAVLVLSGIPLATIGGVFSLYWRNIPFTISAGIGFIALSGIAVLNGLVMVSYMKQLMQEGVSLQQSVYQSALVRLRPVLATAIVDAVGFVPMALSTDVGAEVQRPLATVVIGGVISSTVLTLFVLPALYSLFGRDLSRGKTQE
ncbi:MAG: Cobalt-zinc-cadmium resistance protein CzcA [Gammaproteobacteria bacterium]|nr:Cobalt-zinc-cadmium resistance protein CzcA [Gammaproteobacteria bacterium]